MLLLPEPRNSHTKNLVIFRTSFPFLFHSANSFVVCNVLYSSAHSSRPPRLNTEVRTLVIKWETQQHITITAMTSSDTKSLILLFVGFLSFDKAVHRTSCHKNWKSAQKFFFLSVLFYLNCLVFLYVMMKGTVKHRRKTRLQMKN